MFDNKYKTNTNYNNPYQNNIGQNMFISQPNMDENTLKSSDHYIKWRKGEIRSYIAQILFSLFFAVIIGAALIDSLPSKENALLVFLGVFLIIPVLLLFTSLKKLIELMRGETVSFEICPITFKSPEFSSRNKYFVTAKTLDGEKKVDTERIAHTYLREGELAAVFSFNGKTNHALPLHVYLENDTRMDSVDIANLPYFSTWKTGELAGGIVFLVAITLFGVVGLNTMPKDEPIGPIHLVYVLFFSLFTIPFFSSLKKIRKIRNGEFKYLKTGTVIDKEIIRKVSGSGKNRRRVTEYWVTGKVEDTSVQAEVSQSLYYKMEIGSNMVFFSLDGKQLEAFPLE